MKRDTCEWVKAWYTVCPNCGQSTVQLVGPWDEPHPIALGWRYVLCGICESRDEHRGQHEDHEMDT
jgi:hypothetical protein